MNISHGPVRRCLLLGGTLLGLLICGALTASAASALSFAPRVDYDVGANPWNVAVADFNGDGVADLATAKDASVTVLLGKGGGTFASPADFATGPYPTVAVGDLNGDGHQDLATCNYDAATVSVLLGNGDGTFQSKRDCVTGIGPLELQVGDFNGDGKIDLVTANDGHNEYPYLSTVSVLLGNGDGSFGAKTDYMLGVYYNTWSVAVGDLNGDGWQDLATANAGMDTVSVLLGKGDGTFQPKTNFSTDRGPAEIAIADFNGDQRADLVTADSASYPGAVSVLLGKGDGTFPTKAIFGVGIDPEWVAVGDLNGDGRTDVVTANLGASNVSVLLGYGDGSFAAKRDFPTGSGTHSVTIADLNGDGLSDLVTANAWAGTVSVLLNTTQPGPEAPTVFVGAPVTIPEGGSLSRGGSFADSDSSSWTATVDYGDGSGVKPLYLTTRQSFTLYHFYLDDGVYTATVRVTDDGGLVGSASLKVTVLNLAPRLWNISVPIDPVPMGRQISASVSFSDGGVLDTHTAVWDWGDGSTSAGMISESGGAGTASGTHTYTTPGVYPVSVTVRDDEGEEAFLLSTDYVVVFDPGVGFVTGGGWVDSPSGAYTGDWGATGKASIGFVSKYFKKATYPRGSTRFTLHGSFEFQATAYDSLMVSGAVAQYRGSGTLNGGQGYSFLLSALDGQAKDGGGIDMMRIKIWNTKTGEVVYDTQWGAGDYAMPTTPLGGGSISIHS